jgi:hypothetical protein
VKIFTDFWDILVKLILINAFLWNDQSENEGDIEENKN